MSEHESAAHSNQDPRPTNSSPTKDNVASEVHGHAPLCVKNDNATEHTRGPKTPDATGSEACGREAVRPEAIASKASGHEASGHEASGHEVSASEVGASEANHAEARSADSIDPVVTAKGGEPHFSDLALDVRVQQAIGASGYQAPTAIQSQIIPHMLAGRDVLAQSQTGTGKTAAFALPILSRIDLSQRRPQVLVLAPTRELAIQVSSSFETYASFIEDFRIATIYGGQSYEPQLRQLRPGAQVVVGTPGRMIDHIKQGTLDVSKVRCLVLDEADEMLNMGFLEDVEFVLERTPESRQVALFSATLPEPIRKISQRYLHEPAKVTVKKKTMTADSIRQRALFLPPRDKVFALGRLLEAEATDGVIVFTKTKASTVTVAESLCRQGNSAVALNGDMPQSVRERTVEQFKAGRLDILVATDVAARGLDVSRVSHVINFDLPHDVESYIHRVGRTGRAGRAGEAIIFLSNSQRGRLRTIERATKQRIEVVQLPTADEINELRIKRFQDRITEVTASEDLTMFKTLISNYAAQTGKPMEMIAAALAHLGQQGRPFLAKDRPKRPEGGRADRKRGDHRDSGDGFHAKRDVDRHDRRRKGRKSGRTLGPPEEGMERYRIEVGFRDGVKPGNIVGAVANEAGIDGEFIGPIAIHDRHSTIDLPEGMPRGVYRSLKRTWVAGKQLQISIDKEAGGNEEGARTFQSGDRKRDKSRRKQSGRPSAKAKQNARKRPGHTGGKRAKRKTVMNQK